KEGHGRLDPRAAGHLLSPDEMRRLAPGNERGEEDETRQPSFRRLKDHSISNSATVAPSFSRPIERAGKATPSPVAMARSIAAFMATPSEHVKVASCAALRMTRALRPVTSIDIRAELSAMRESAGAP